MKYRILLIVFCINYSFIFCNISSTEYWDQLKKKANEKYSGLDLEFDISASVIKETDDETNGELKFSVPLYSSSEKRAKEDEKRDFLEKGAELIKQIEVNEKMLQFLRDQEKIKKATMYEEGASGTEAYFNLVERIVEKEAGIREAERKLEALLL